VLSDVADRLTIVMVTQDPVMSLGGFVVVPHSCANCACGCAMSPAYNSSDGSQFVRAVLLKFDHHI